jgi:hypothetical protein
MDLRGNRPFVSFERLASESTCRRSVPKESDSKGEFLSANVASVVIANSVAFAGVRRKGDTLAKPHRVALDAEGR